MALAGKPNTDFSVSFETTSRAKRCTIRGRRRPMPPADLDDSPAPAPPPNRPKKMEKCQLQATDALLDGVLAHLRTDDESPKPKSLEAIASLIHDFDPDKPERVSVSPAWFSSGREKSRKRSQTKRWAAGRDS